MNIPRIRQSVTFGTIWNLLRYADRLTPAPWGAQSAAFSGSPWSRPVGAVKKGLLNIAAAGHAKTLAFVLTSAPCNFPQVGTGVA